MKEKIYIGIDVGGTKIAAGIVTGDGIILAQNKQPTPQKAQKAVICRAVVSAISDLLKSANIVPQFISGIGIGVPGIVRPNRKEILITPNTNLTDAPLASLIEKTFGVPVFLENDVNLGLLGEKWLGAARNANNVVGIFPGTGVGGAIMLNGQLFTGSQGAAGELGHMIIDMKSPHQSAGIFGSLEALASRLSIEREIKSALTKRKKTIITKLLPDRTSQIKSKMISEALNQKDPVVVGIINDVCQILGKACVNLRHILNPDMIVFGGGVIEACGDYMLPRIQKVSAADPFFKGIDYCQIVKSLLGDDAIILGAVALLKQDQESQPVFGQSLYPTLGIKGSTLLVNQRSTRASFYVRADGKLTILAPAERAQFISPRHEIHHDALKKICKKNPQLLIIGSRLKGLKLTVAGRKHLREKNIIFKLLSLTEAAKEYNTATGRKAVFILQANQ